MNNKSFEIRVGETYGRWTVINNGKLVTRGKSYRQYWVCECSCIDKTIKEIDGYNLYNGNSASCGCINKEKLKCREVKVKTISFKEWCCDNNNIDMLSLWDYKLNKFSPEEICYSSNKKFWFKCKKGIHDSELKALNFLTKNKSTDIRCNKCNSFGQYLIDTYGKNSLNIYWSNKNTMNPFYIDRCASKTKIVIKCDYCNNEKITTPYIFVKNGLSCPMCGDGVSIPNKIAFNLLNQLGVDFECEYSPEWIKPKKYDFLFISKNKKYILEMDGKWHNEDNMLSGQTRETSKYIDDYKDKQAMLHNIPVIRINCEKSDLCFIKNNILNSNVSAILNLDDVNWDECEKYINGSIVKAVCDMWNSGVHSTLTISTNLKIGRTSTIRYLNKGKLFGWCNYDGEKEKKKKIISQSKMVYCIELDKVFNSLRHAERFTNISRAGISRCCNHYQDTTEYLDGVQLHWVFYDEYKIEK